MPEVPATESVHQGLKDCIIAESSSLVYTVRDSVRQADVKQ